MTYIVVFGNNLSKPYAYEVAQSRISCAFSLYSTLKGVIIVSGTDVSGIGITEAEYMARELIRLGVPRDSIIIEPLARNTMENIIYSFGLITPLNGDIIWTSSSYHTARIREYLDHLGLPGTVVGARDDSIPDLLDRTKRESAGGAF